MACMQTWLEDKTLAEGTQKDVNKIVGDLEEAVVNGNQAANQQLKYWALAEETSNKYKEMAKDMQNPTKFFLKKYPELTSPINFN